MDNLINDRVRVQIFGREYEIDPGGLTPLELQSVAAFVDERMRDIADRTSIVDTQKIAVLAALNIALEYIQMREKSSTGQSTLSPRLETLNQILDQALKD